MHKFFAKVCRSKPARMIREFDKDEGGALTVLEIVLGVAAAAFFMAIIIKFGKGWFETVFTMIRNLFA